MSAGFSRRAVLAAAAALALTGAAGAHTPYRQWVVYRRKHLMIGCHRGDEAGYLLAKQVAGDLLTHLPESRARVARAPAASRLAGLLATDQLDLALLDAATARAMRAGEGVFAAYGALDLGTLAVLPEGRALLAHARFPERHGRLVADALIGEALAPVAIQWNPPCPWRPESLALLGRDGAPPPD